MYFLIIVYILTTILFFLIIYSIEVVFEINDGDILIFYKK